MNYWDDVEEYEKRKHKRDMNYADKIHNHKMKELDKEVELHRLKKEKVDG